MPFLSPEFALVFVAFLPLYWSLQQRPEWQNALLLLLSLGLLYYVKPSALYTVCLYSAFIALLDRALDEESQYPQSALLLGIVVSVLFLASMKYFDDYAPWLRQWGLSEELDLLMPLGLSYYTFQAMSYLVERYRGTLERMPIGHLYLHFSFFPTITSGPIIRASGFKSALGWQEGMAEQLARERELTHASTAVTFIFIGLIKAWVLSTHIAQHWVRPVFENPMDYSALQQISAYYAYTLQLYFDFSGYSDLVCGLAYLLGFQLPQNFHSPLNACNIQQFWARWHISLSTWIRDYLYIPLGGSRHGLTRTQVNLLLAFVLSGIWHGSSANFLLWGLAHGLALVLFNLWRQWRTREDEEEEDEQSALGRWLSNGLAWFITFHFVVLSFVLFRTTHLGDLNHLYQALWQSTHPAQLQHALPIAFMLLYLSSYPLRQYLRHYTPRLLDHIPVALWFVPLSLCFTLLIRFAPEGIPEFIYANF